MYIILTRDVPKFGQKNSLHRVKRGFYVNYLQPGSLARIETVKMIESMKDSIIAAREASRMARRVMSEKAGVLAGARIVLEARTSAKGTLFRAIAEKTIAKEILEKYKVELDPDNIEMEHIKKLGEHEVRVKIGAEMVVVKVEVVKKEITDF